MLRASGESAVNTIALPALSITTCLLQRSQTFADSRRMGGGGSEVFVALLISAFLLCAWRKHVGFGILCVFLLSKPTDTDKLGNLCGLRTLLCHVMCLPRLVCSQQGAIWPSPMLSRDAVALGRCSYAVPHISWHPCFCQVLWWEKHLQVLWWGQGVRICYVSSGPERNEGYPSKVFELCNKNIRFCLYWLFEVTTSVSILYIYIYISPTLQAAERIN